MFPTYRKSIKTQNSLGLAASLVSRGEELLNLGWAQDPVYARDCFYRAGLMQDPKAWNYLGICSEMGLGITPSFNTAVAYYQLAASGGSVEAIANLAYCMALGQGTPADIHEALYLYSSIATQDNIAAFNAQVLEQGAHPTNLLHHVLRRPRWFPRQFTWFEPQACQNLDYPELLMTSSEAVRPSRHNTSVMTVPSEPTHTQKIEVAPIRPPLTPFASIAELQKLEEFVDDAPTLSLSLVPRPIKPPISYFLESNSQVAPASVIPKIDTLALVVNQLITSSTSTSAPPLEPSSLELRFTSLMSAHQSATVQSDAPLSILTLMRESARPRTTSSNGFTPPMPSSVWLLEPQPLALDVPSDTSPDTSELKAFRND